MKMSNLKTTAIFSVDITEIKDTSGDMCLGYTVTNLKTSVREFETFSLAEALSYTEMTEGVVTQLFDEKETDAILLS